MTIFAPSVPSLLFDQHASPQYSTFEILDVDEAEHFEHQAEIPHTGSSDGFDEMVLATVPHFAIIENTFRTVSTMWKECYRYITSSAISQRQSSRVFPADLF
ncbi:uncharacterized protein I206_103889 [Kwoniella pini CBS 10737]|uniref:Uncharacterized protein n=1 Tax=Kwoniella pini CBS 10737 TaxID=1296096 RepID=A0A1B9I394_9TREE|nr:uncharacterized protein I206_04538 [Kwoniella pini CBS 10737]OCF50007.1 hypothetical protein I206_04538 [Kwoniella pini CBS 10737]